MAIQSFACRNTKTLFNKGSTSKFTSFQTVAERKLALLHAAAALNDLISPRGNKLHSLDKDRQGQHAIRVNDKYRVCFVWTAAGPEDVEITDYH